jgi:hypothetical protein
VGRFGTIYRILEAKPGRGGGIRATFLRSLGDMLGKSALARFRQDPVFCPLSGLALSASSSSGLFHHSPQEIGPRRTAPFRE